MLIINKRLTAFLRLLLLSVTLLPSVSFGQLYQNLSIGNAKALALGNAVTADPPVIDALHFNPAGIFTAAKQGRTYQLNFVYAPKPDLKIGGQWSGEYPDIGLTINGCDTECILQNNDTLEKQTYVVDEFLSYVPFSGESESGGLLPRGGFVYRGDRFAFGLATYATVSGGFSIDGESFASHSTVRNAGINLVMAAPGVAWQARENLTVGISFPLNYAGFRDVNQVRLPNLAIGLIAETIENLCSGGADDLCTDDGTSVPLYDAAITLETSGEDKISPSVNLGVIWQPYDWLSLGWVYQGEVKHNLKGSYIVSYDEALLRAFNTGLFNVLPNSPQVDSVPDSYQETGEAKVNQVLPAHTALGISVQLTQTIKVNFDIKRTDTSILDESVTYFDQPTYISAITETLAGSEPFSSARPLGFEDGWNFAQGIEYQVNSFLSLRAGYEWRESVIPKENRKISSFLGDTKILSFGGEYVFTDQYKIAFSAANISSYQSIPRGTSYTTTWDAGTLFATHPGYDLETDFETNVVVLGISRNL